MAVPISIYPTSPSPLGVHSLWVQKNLLVYFWMTIGGRRVEFDVSIETESRFIVSLYIYFLVILFLEERWFIAQTQWLFLNGSVCNMLYIYFPFLVHKMGLEWVKNYFLGNFFLVPHRFVLNCLCICRWKLQLCSSSESSGGEMESGDGRKKEVQDNIK